MTYSTKWAVACRVGGRTFEWTGSGWALYGRCHEFREDAEAQLDAARAAMPVGASEPKTEPRTFLPSAEHGRQPDLVGLRPFRVLPGDAGLPASPE